VEEDGEVIGNQGVKHGTTNPWHTFTDHKPDCHMKVTGTGMSRRACAPAG
jgi:hypothetical protein